MTDYSAEDDSPPVIRYQVRKLLYDVGRLFDWKGEVDQERVELRGTAKSLSEDMRTLKASVDSLRRVILGFSLSIAGAAVTIALSVLVATGKL